MKTSKFPFVVKLPKKKFFYETLSEEALDEVIAQGIADYEAGRVCDSKTLREQIKKGFPI